MLFSLKWAKEPIFTNYINQSTSKWHNLFPGMLVCITYTSVPHSHANGKEARTGTSFRKPTENLPSALISVLFKAASRAHRRVPHRVPPVNPCCTQAGVLFWNENQCFSKFMGREGNDPPFLDGQTRRQECGCLHQLSPERKGPLRLEGQRAPPIWGSGLCSSM